MLEGNLLKRCGYETSWQQFPSQDPLLAICPRVLVCNAGTPAKGEMQSKEYTLTPELLILPKEAGS